MDAGFYRQGNGCTGLREDFAFFVDGHDPAAGSAEVDADIYRFARRRCWRGGRRGGGAARWRARCGRGFLGFCSRFSTARPRQHAETAAGRGTFSTAASPGGALRRCWRFVAGKLDAYGILLVGSRRRRRAGKTGFAMLGRDCGENTAAHIELGTQTHVARSRGGHQVFQNLIGDGLVEGAFIAIGPDVEFQRLEFDATAVGNVVQKERGEVRLSGFWAQTSELRHRDLDGIIAPRIRVLKSLQLPGGLGRHQGVPCASVAAANSFNSFRV